MLILDFKEAMVSFVQETEWKLVTEIIISEF